jgi:uncharacterized cupredoxin-like copper-binding protein
LVKKLVTIGISILVLLATACGGGSNDAGHASDDEHGSGSTQGSVMGEPAEASEADRTIKVVMLDELAYDPEQLEASEGDVITFEVVNEGSARHEFVLGGPDYQETHEGDMADGGHDEEIDNGVSVEPGDTASFTWRFTETGEVLYGCHEPGHFDGGMVGTVEVS